jgi:hypothetical protein
LIMATRNVPDGDSAELYFAMPSTRIATATTFTVEATYLDTNRSVAGAHLYFANNEESYTSISGNRINVRAGAHHFYVCVRLNTDETIVNGDRVQVKLTPTNNKDWFQDLNYTASAVIMNRHQDSKLTIPDSAYTEEGAWEVIDCTVDPPLEKVANFNSKITHITTNSTALDGIQISVDGGITWTNPLNSVNYQLPVGNTGFKIRYYIKTNLIEEGNRYFDITTVETTAVKVFKPTVNVKTRVTVIDTTVLNYGDLIGTYCNGRDLYGIYSDGNKGRYEEPLILNAATCGAVILPPDTVLQTFCAGTTRIQHLSDGVGGYYRKILAYNSEACNYVVRAPNPDTTVTPTVLNPTRKGNTVLLNPDGDVFGALLRDNSVSNYSTMFGKWYFEVDIYLPTATHLEVGMGFGTASTNMAEWLGANNQSWSWWPYDSTKYHSDVQGIYAQTIDVVDKDNIGVYLDMENHRFGFAINGVFQGWTYEDLYDVKMFFYIAGRFDSWSWINFGKYAFKYPVPEGYYSGFGTIRNPPPEKGTLLSTFCVGVDKWGRYADGHGGFTEALISRNQVECGWIDPKPPAGTVIGFVCDGYDKYNKIADGDGGFTLRLVQINSTECGYVPPGQGSLSNVLIQTGGSYIDPSVVLSSDRLSYTNLKGSIVADYGNLSGIWMWEFVSWTGNIRVGFQNRDNVPSTTLNVWDTYGIGIEPLTGMVNIYGVRETMFAPVAEGTPIGFKIDFKAQTITIYTPTESKVVLTKLNYPAPVKGNRFYPSVMAVVDGGNGTFNFGQLDMSYLEPGVQAYKRPSNPYPQRGTALSYKCEHWTRYVSRADGNGDSYIELFENDSATCGWYPDPPIGTVLGYFCVGYERWRTQANGNYTTIDVLVEAKSTECGYVPAGTVIALYCIDKDQWATISDGEDGTYEELVRANSPNCGYSDNDGDLSDQEADPKYNLIHKTIQPVTNYDIIHGVPREYFTEFPPFGSLVGFSCQGVSYVQTIHNGIGGTTDIVLEKKSRRCGYNNVPVNPIVDDNYVVLLLHGDNLTTDSSKYRRTVGFSNPAAKPTIVENGNPVGGGSFNFSTACDINIAYDASLGIGSMPFCVDARVKLSNPNVENMLITNISSRGGYAYEWGISVRKDCLIFYVGVRGSSQSQRAFYWPEDFILLPNVFYSVAFQKTEDNEYFIYLNGARSSKYILSPFQSGVAWGSPIAGIYKESLDLGMKPDPITIGAFMGNLNPFIGEIAELRMVIGQNVYNAASYPVRTDRFPDY